MELLYAFWGLIVLWIIILSLMAFMKDKDDDWSIPDDPGAKAKEIWEADPRDFKVIDLLWEPSEKELKKTPKQRNLIDEWLDHTYNQGSTGSCTSVALTHVMKILNAIDYEMKKWIELDWTDLRTKMGHKIWDKRGDYLENALKTLYKKWELGSVYDERKTFFIDGYAYHPFDASDKWIKLVKYLIWVKGYPLYFATRWNRKVWMDMVKGEITHIITPEQATWGHALCIAGYDDEYFYVVNSWTPNYPKDNPTISMFKWPIRLFKEAIQKWMVYWRFFVVFDKIDKENMLFPDFNNNKWKEAYEAVKWAKENGIVKWVPHSDGKYYLEPNRPLTRLEFIVMLYRYTQWLQQQRVEKG